MGTTVFGRASGVSNSPISTTCPLDTTIRPASNTCSGDPGEVADGEVKAQLVNLGSWSTAASPSRRRGDPRIFGSGSRYDGLRDLLSDFHCTFVAGVRTNDLDADRARRAAHIRPAADFQGQDEWLESRQTTSRRGDARPAIRSSRRARTDDGPDGGLDPADCHHDRRGRRPGLNAVIRAAVLSAAATRVGMRRHPRRLQWPARTRGLPRGRARPPDARHRARDRPPGRHDPGHDQPRQPPSLPGRRPRRLDPRGRSRRRGRREVPGRGDRRADRRRRRRLAGDRARAGRGGPARRRRAQDDRQRPRRARS